MIVFSGVVSPFLTFPAVGKNSYRNTLIAGEPRAASRCSGLQGPQIPELSSGAKLSPASLEWLLDTVTASEGGSSSRTVLQKLLLSHWHKRWFLNGNIAVTPILGRRILFQVRIP